MRLLGTIASAWLLLFWVDTGLGLFDELVAQGVGLHPLGWVRGMARGMGLLAMPLVWLAVGLSPAVRIRTWLPPLVFTAWTALGASPLSIVLMGRSELGLLLVGLQALVAAWTSWHAIRQEGPWLFGERSFPGPRWGRFAAWTVAHALVVPPLLVAYGFGSADLALRRATAGFVSLGLDGVRVAHRTYADDGRTVDLIGMIHLGRRSAYEELFAPIPAEGTLVLEEGVRDTGGLLITGPLYDRVAAGLGLEAQRPVAEMSVLETRNADVDVATFSEGTRGLLRKVFAIYTAEDPAAAVLDYLIFVRSQKDAETLLSELLEDVVHRRNQHLLLEIDRALGERRRVVVPWGAYHLPGIEQALLARGFERRSERVVTLVPFGSVRGPAGDPADPP